MHPAPAGRRGSALRNPSTRRARRAPAVLLAAAALAGCGDDDGGPSGPPTPERVQACLSDKDSVRDVGTIAAGADRVSAVTAEQRRALAGAVRGALTALSVKTGGPAEHDGTIVEAPVRVTELYFFGAPGGAARAADRLEAAVGDAEESVLNGVRPLGRVLAVHYSFGIGDRPGRVALDDDEIEPVEDCLREAGYL